MRENFGIKIGQQNEAPSRKTELKTEFGQLRHDWFERKGIDLTGKKYSEIKQAIKEFYKEVGPTIKETLEDKGETLEDEISATTKERMDFHRVAEIRKKLNLPKWVSLPETVAFVKTVLDVDSQDLQEKYVEYATKGISLDDMRNVLAYDNDVKPARLDTDIYHQSPERSRSAVEVVSNAVDAVNSVNYTIGRFGVGFYQILSHLKSDKDVVKVRTGNKESGFYEINFRLKDGEIQTHMQESVDRADKGTTVELALEDFPKDEAEALIKKHFAYNSVAKVICNGELVNDLSSMGVDQTRKPAIEVSVTNKGYAVRDGGVGMSPQVILEKLIVPKLSGKKPVQELKQTENIKPGYFVERRGEAEALTSGKAVINVGGVVVEEIELKGINTVKTLVVDLPPFTMLGEERNQVATDEVAILATKKLTEEIVATGDIELINSLAQVVSSFQQRSFHREKENNLVTYLQDKAGKELSDGKNYLPNIAGFERLNIPDKVLIDPMIRQTNWRSMPEFLRPNLQGDGNFVHIAPLRDTTYEPIVRWRNQIILSKEIYEKFEGDPTMVNLFLKAYGQGNGIEIKKLEDKQKEVGGRSEDRERREYNDFSEFVTQNWELLKFSSQEIAQDILGKLSAEQRKAAELVHRHIIEKFPENYAKYFVDAVLYNQLPELKEEYLSNFASLAKSDKLPQLLSNLTIYPIISREPQTEHFEGINKSKLEYKDTYSSAAMDESCHGVGSDFMHNPPFCTKDCKRDAKDNQRGEWYPVERWDRRNLVHLGGEVFPGEARFLPDNEVFFVWDKEKMCFIDAKNKQIIASQNIPEKLKNAFHNNPYFKHNWNGNIDYTFLHISRIKFGNKQLVILESELIFDIAEGKEFNPMPELGEMRLDLIYKRYGQISYDFDYLIYEKKAEDNSSIFYKYFPDGTWKEIALNEAQLKEQSNLADAERGKEFVDKNRAREEERAKKERMFIFGKKPVLVAGSAYIDARYKYLYGYKIPESLDEYTNKGLGIHSIDVTTTNINDIEKHLLGYKFLPKYDGRNGFYGSAEYEVPMTLLKATSNLSEAKADSIRKILESSTVESDQKHRRFLNRIFKYAHLSDEAFDSIAGILLEVDDIESYVLTEELIIEAEVRLQKYDNDVKKNFYCAWMKMANPEWNKEEAAIFLGKWAKVFTDKIANLPDIEKDEIYEIFNGARDYGQDFIANGWNIIKYRTPVPAHLIPEKIRPLVEFLRTDEHSILSSAHKKIELGAPEEFTLSKLIQTKRLNEAVMQKFGGSSAELASIIRTKTSNKKQDHIQREIIHPIYYQSVNNPYLFIRELVQNAHDAAIKHPEQEEREILMDIFSREDKEVTLRMEDHVGMSLQEVLNYFLIPGETTKLHDKETIGYFGQGLFTLFRGSKEVVLKTGKGDGLVTKLKITPVKDENGMTVDLNLNIEQEQDNFKGTTIERTVETEYPSVEAAYIKNAACTFTSLVNADVVDIKLNNSRINDAQHKLASVDIPELGELSIYDAPNNVVTQRGLFIKSLDSDYSTGMHDVETLLKKKGYVINIPDNVSLTRSRNELARKQEVLTQVREYLPLLKLKSYIEIFRQDIEKGQVIQLDNLPYDYFYWPYPAGGKIVEDANKLRRGDSIVDVSNYLERGELISLLVLLPVVEVDNKTWSLAELKEASLADKPPLESEEKYEKIPSIIAKKLLEGKKTHESMAGRYREAVAEKKVAPDFKFDTWESQPEFVRELISKNFDAYKRMAKKAGEYNELVGRPEGNIETTFYHEPNSSAHANRLFSAIGWNLNHWQGWQMSPFRVENPSHKQLEEFIETWSHERAHISEHSGSFSHNPTFYRKQAETLAKLMYRTEKGLQAT